MSLMPALGPTAADGGPGNAKTIRLRLRTRVEPFKGSGRWEEVHFEKNLSVPETAILICDMWDKHWCRGASERCEILARRMAPLAERARAHGIQIIHAPSDTMEFYKDYPQRMRILELPRAEPPPSLGLSDPALPIDDSDGGCDTPGDKVYKAWTRQNAVIPIAGDDAISDNGKEIYSLLHARGIKTLLVMGVHTNMCILNRSFAIRSFTRRGLDIVLLRDLTDSLYNPALRPYVSHDQGTELIIGYIEKFWCPSVSSTEIMTALDARS